MSKAIEASLPVLEILAQIQISNRHVIKQIVSVAQKIVICGFCEIAYNVLYSRVPLTSAQTKELKRYKTVIRQLAEKSTLSRQLLVRNPRLVALLLEVSMPMIKLLDKNDQSEQIFSSSRDSASEE